MPRRTLRTGKAYIDDSEVDFFAPQQFQSDAITDTFCILNAFDGFFFYEIIQFVLTASKLLKI